MNASNRRMINAPAVVVWLLLLFCFALFSCCSLKNSKTKLTARVLHLSVRILLALLFLSPCLFETEYIHSRNNRRITVFLRSRCKWYGRDLHTN